MLVDGWCSEVKWVVDVIVVVERRTEERMIFPGSRGGQELLIYLSRYKTPFVCLLHHACW